LFWQQEKDDVMEIALSIIVAALLLVASGYVHKKISAYTKGAAKIILVRALLIVVGIGFGFLSTAELPGHLPKALAFLIGFGIVHLPAAVILFVKGRRGEGKS
jgi:hypothetical protein